MNIYIKNMVCPRCIMAVESIFNEMGINKIQVRLGEVSVFEEFAPSQIPELRSKLETLGFELLDDKQQQLIEKIKNTIISNIEHCKKLSEILSSELNRDYSALSKLFSSTEGITIEQYAIIQKIERVKELLSYDQLSLSEIAFRLNYSSVAHLSSQFKKTTGFTPSEFKAQGIKLRKSLDSI